MYECKTSDTTKHIFEKDNTNKDISLPTCFLIWRPLSIQTSKDLHKFDPFRLSIDSDNKDIFWKTLR